MKQCFTFVALSLFVVCSNAAATTFKVIAPGTKGDVQVSVNGVNTKLTASDSDVPYFVGQAELASGASYKYIVDGAAESFDRKLDNGRTSTRNDFYGRSVTYANLPELPWPVKDQPQWTRGGQNDPMWDSNYIPSIFISGNQAEMENLIVNVAENIYQVKFTFIGPDNVQVFNNCSFQLHKPGKKKNNAKQSWKWSLPEGQYIGNRDWIKIRHMEEDPTQLREKTYADVLAAVGTYGNKANIIRFFINGEGFGTFNMLDDIMMYSYIRSMFYDGHPPQQMGPLYDGMSGADFGYHENDDPYYSFNPNPQSPGDSLAIKPMTKEFNDTDVTNNAALSKFGESFDIDQFLRFMVVEYLTADWDGYWQQQTNDGAYQDPTDKKWYYLSQDYDATFGVNLDVPDGKEFVKVSYTEWPKRYPGGIMINRLLQNTDMKNKFETYLKDTVQVLFNNVTLTNRVLNYHQFISPDLEWDRSIKQRSPGINFGWTYQQTEQNLWGGVTAPNNNGGGATWGLVEWIAAKAQAVASEFHVTITSQPVGPPNQGSVAAAGTPNQSSTPASGTQTLVDKSAQNSGSVSRPALITGVASATLVLSALLA